MAQATTIANRGSSALLRVRNIRVPIAGSISSPVSQKADQMPGVGYGQLTGLGQFAAGPDPAVQSDHLPQDGCRCRCGGQIFFRHPWTDQLAGCHGSRRLTPVSTKSLAFRVAKDAACERQMAAICASNPLIGLPCFSRLATMSA
ncbi:hypothetical protein [Actinoplanes solisilvae]|uniref:hypothetical protein n=1 Tax=Actinoplanes solisilvae TaxID=2486853 RepID=UPI0013E363E8|nr:hypothetical protein [Actinoplanes solisilvae]